jgi:hypothetical protein
VFASFDESGGVDQRLLIDPCGRFDADLIRRELELPDQRIDLPQTQLRRRLAFR